MFVHVTAAREALEEEDPLPFFNSSSALVVTTTTCQSLLSHWECRYDDIHTQLVATVGLIKKGKIDQSLEGGGETVHRYATALQRQHA